jgi:hypothetical protein
MRPIPPCVGALVPDDKRVGYVVSCCRDNVPRLRVRSSGPLQWVMRSGGPARPGSSRRVEAAQATNRLVTNKWASTSRTPRCVVLAAICPAASATLVRLGAAHEAPSTGHEASLGDPRYQLAAARRARWRPHVLRPCAMRPFKHAHACAPPRLPRARPSQRTSRPKARHPAPRDGRPAQGHARVRPTSLLPGKSVRPLCALKGVRMGPTMGAPAVTSLPSLTGAPDPHSDPRAHARR